ncbi:MAG TPA: molybdopterin cofactor-binding domain-containing protein, partial [Sphingomonas sp.]|uniref:molybdopterin cofactor-binding domain-containing protein n=1 Tax=Sphingomonas sp. TaxID=28214 RepID=UPI002C8C746B
MTTSTRLHEFALDEPAVATRRSILQGGAAVLVGFSVNALLPLSEASAESNVAGTVRPPLTPEQLDSFLALRKDGSFVAFFGKIDPGQGLDVAISQIVAEELDISVDQVSVIQGDTSQTVDQGGASGSFGVEKGAVPLRFAAAEVRRILINRASSILKTPASALTTESGSVCVKAEPGQRVAYKDLIGSGFFESKLEWNGQVGNLLVSRGVAQPKSRSEYKLVGKSVPRTDIGDNVYGRHAYVTDIRLPNMLHARVIRPPIVGAEPVSIEVSSLKAIPAV